VHRQGSTGRCGDTTALAPPHYHPPHLPPSTAPLWRNKSKYVYDKAHLRCPPNYLRSANWFRSIWPRTRTIDSLLDWWRAINPILTVTPTPCATLLAWWDVKCNKSKPSLVAYRIPIDHLLQVSPVLFLYSM